MQYMWRRRVFAVRLRAGPIKRAVHVHQTCFHPVRLRLSRAGGRVGLPDEAKSQEATEFPKAGSACEVNKIFEETHDPMLSQERLTYRLS
jgi:hypothetical protein